MKLTTRLYIESRLRMGGAVPPTPVPPHACMVCTWTDTFACTYLYGYIESRLRMGGAVPPTLRSPPCLHGVHMDTFACTYLYGCHSVVFGTKQTGLVPSDRKQVRPKYM